MSARSPILFCKDVHCCNFDDEMDEREFLGLNEGGCEWDRVNNGGGDGIDDDGRGGSVNITGWC